MKRFEVKDINTPAYWDSHQTAFDFGLRQEEYRRLAGKGGMIVELGCGLSPFLSQSLFTDPWGLDFSAATIRQCKEKYPGVMYVVGSAIQTPFDNKMFEVSVAGELIEHLENPKDLIAEMVRITKRRIIISSPKLEFQDPEHLWEFEPEDLVALLAPYGSAEAHEIKSERFPGRSYVFATCDL